MAQGMLGITPQLEAKGRKGDTEVGYISKGSLVIPVALAQSEEAAEMRDALTQAFEYVQLDFNNYTVTAENTDYASDDSPIQAHLTNGEIVIPKQVFKAFKDLEGALKELFGELDINYNQYVVGHKDNAINPETGLPEFGWLSKAWNTITKPIKKVVQAVVDPIVKLGENIVNGIGDALEGVVKLADDAIQNPYVRAAVSIIYPPAAPYINAYAKLDSGEKLTAADIASLGLSAASDLGSITVDPNITKAITTGAKIADGADPLTTLAGAYGADFVDQLGLQDTVNSTLSNAFGSDTATWLTDRMDINQLTADIVAGTDTNRLIANQFGDEIANYIGSGDPNMTALGYAGIDSAIALDNGESESDALMAGAKTYYDKGGKLPDVANIASVAGINFPDVNFDWNGLAVDLNIPGTDLLAQGYDWLKNQNINLGNLDFLKGLSVPDMGLDLGQFADLGGNFGDLNWKGVDWRTTGYDLGTLKDMGVNLGDLNIGNIPLPAFMLSATDETPQAADQLYIDPFADTTAEEDTTLEATPLSQALLQSTRIA